MATSVFFNSTSIILVNLKAVNVTGGNKTSIASANKFYQLPPDNENTER